MTRLFDFLFLALERLRQHTILVFWTLVGLTAAVTLSLSLLLYVDAVNTSVLIAQLDAEPYVFRLRYLGSWEGNITRADVESADATLRAELVQGMGLPTRQDMRYISIGRWNVTSTEKGNFGSFAVGSLNNYADKVTLVMGDWYSATPTEDGVIPVMIAESFMYKTGLQVGDTVNVTRAGAEPATFKIVGMWRSNIAEDTSWVLPSRFFEEIFLLPEWALWQMTDGMTAPVEEVDWQIVFEGQTVRANDVAALIPVIRDAERNISRALPGIRMDVSPLQNMETFTAKVNQLTKQLVIVVMPVGGLILYFVAMLAGMLVGRQQQEDLLLNSRGMSRRALLGLHGLIWLLLGVIAFGIAVVASPYVVELVGRTTTFMRFDNPNSDLVIHFTQNALLAGLGAAGLAASCGLWAAGRTTRQTLTGFKRQKARGGTAWWQKFYFDIMLLVPAGYVYYTLKADDGLTASATEPFADPLVFLAPTIFALGATLLFLRLLPITLSIGARFLSYTNNVSMLMALRELNRAMWRYRGTLLMMGFTLSLIGFTASMASTLDQSLKDVIEYKIGADSVLVVESEAQTTTGSDSSGQTTVTVEGYNTLPASDLQTIDGIEQISRVGSYKAQLVLPTQRLNGVVIGVDRWALATVTYFRDDYADESLAELMNLLAQDRTGVIINSQTARDYNLTVGQNITLNISALNTTYTTTVPILGMTDYFPTLNPKDGFFVIGNIDPIFELVGTELPHNFWISLHDGANVTDVETDVRALGYPILRWLDPQAELFAAQTEPSRRGILGFLSVGFVSAIFLTLVGSIIQTVASFRAQALQMGALRAMGMKGVSVSTYLIASQGIAVLSGVCGGTAIGVLTTLAFLPLLDFSGGLPPYLLRVAWDDIVLVYAVFAGMLLAITVLTTFVLNRQQLATLVKLGDV